MPPKNYKPGDRLSAADVNYAIQGANRVANMRGSSRGNTSISVRDDSVVVDVRPQNLADNTIIFCVGDNAEVPVGPPAVVPRYSVVMVEDEHTEQLNFYKRPSANGITNPSIADSHLHGQAGGFVRTYGLGLVAYDEDTVASAPLVAGDYLDTTANLYYASYCTGGAMQVISTSGAAAGARSTLETRRLTASGWLSLYPGPAPYIKLAVVRVGVNRGAGGAILAKAGAAMTVDDTQYAVNLIAADGTTIDTTTAKRPPDVVVSDENLGMVIVDAENSQVFAPLGIYLEPRVADPTTGLNNGRFWLRTDLV